MKNPKREQKTGSKVYRWLIVSYEEEFAADKQCCAQQNSMLRRVYS